MKSINLKNSLLDSSKVLLSFVLLFGLTAAHAKSLNIVSWGGAYTDSQKKAYDAPFTKKTGIVINNIDKGGSAPAGIRAQVESGSVTWDLVDVLEGPAMALCEDGLVEKIDYNNVLAKGANGLNATEDFVSGLNGCFIPTIVYATTFAYNHDTYKDPATAPKTIADVFDLKKFPGKRALEKIPANNLEWALLADGVAKEDLYKVLSTDAGVKRAFAKLDTIKDSVIWWTAGAQPPQLLADKEVAIASDYNGRFFSAIVNEKQPFTMLWDSASLEFDGWVVPKGKLSKEIKEYLKFAADTQRLADQAKYISYAPARKSSIPMVSTHAETGVDMMPHMPTGQKNTDTMFYKGAEFWADNGETLAEEFNAWLIK